MHLYWNIFFIYLSCTDLDERGCPIVTTSGWASSAGKQFSGIYVYFLCKTREQRKLFLPPFRQGTTIATAVGGVVLVFILLALLVFYLRRQKQLKRKETMRRYLQEHEVRAEDGEFTSRFNLKLTCLLPAFVCQAGGAFDPERRVAQSGSDADPERDWAEKRQGAGCRSVWNGLQGVWAESRAVAFFVRLKTFRFQETLVL